MGDRLKGKVAVVTGSGRGIGRGVVLTLAAEGAKVVVNDLGGAVNGSGAATGPADEVVAEIKQMGGEAVANYDSVATVEGGNNIIKTAVDNFGKIDILVNNAGILRDRMIFNMAPEEWDTVIKVHLYGAFNCTKPAAILMRQQRSGRIISMTSPTGLKGNTGQANYGAAKAGIIGFSLCCALDLGKYGVTVNVISPSGDTRMNVTPEVLAARERKAKLGKYGAGVAAHAAWGTRDPLDVGPAVVWLASDAAANINGCIFRVAGGQIILFSNHTPIKFLCKEGRWTPEELDELMPTTLAADLVNPAPPEPPKQG